MRHYESRIRGTMQPAISNMSASPRAALPWRSAWRMFPYQWLTGVFFCTDWLILLSKRWLTDNAVICSLGANHGPADAGTHECITKGDDGGTWLVDSDAGKEMDFHTLGSASGRMFEPRQTQNVAAHTCLAGTGKERGTFTSRCWRCLHGHQSCVSITGNVSGISSLCDPRHLPPARKTTNHGAIKHE